MSEEKNINIDAVLVRLISGQQAWHYRVIPRDQDHDRIEFYADEDHLQEGMEEVLEVAMGRRISIRPTESSMLQSLLERYYPSDRQDSRLQGAYYSGDQDSFLGNLITEARTLKSSDIHIEIYEERCRVRIRIDGMLVQRYLLEKKQYPSLINKIKIISNLDIAQKRLPQDGRIFFEQNGHKLDIRVSVIPTLHGEKVVLRLLNNDATDIDIHTLGFSDFDLGNYLEGLKKTQGILLISGPTGSGKTTTLYATLKLLNKDTRNLLTIEDPIEYTLEGVNQVQLKESIGLTFAAALRNFLRQDPDVIMLGEIRDPDTANMAIRMALTGHLVLSTIHTNSAWGTISRLVDMGIPSFLLADTIKTTVAQRLVRLLCPTCKKEISLDAAELPRRLQAHSRVVSHFVSTGCTECFNTGYKGRKAVYEVIPVDQELAAQIKARNFNIEAMLQERGIKTLSENAFEMFEKGLTSLEEIYSLVSM